MEGFVFCGFDDLTPEYLDQIEPSVILSALACRDFDVLDLALRLKELAFSGRFRVLVRDLPQPEVVTREVRAAAPGLDFSIFAV